MVTRDNALKILKDNIKEESLLRHSFTVEAVMRHFAKLYNGDENEWGIIGLLHDIDFERFPDEHCRKTREILLPLNIPEHIVRAIESHGYNLVNDVKPETDAEKVLYTVDELTGLIYASAILRPSKSILDLETKSVKKKWKQKSFAANVSREVIEQGAQMLGKPIEYVIEQTIEGMKIFAEEIGLRGHVEVSA